MEQHSALAFQNLTEAQKQYVLLRQGGQKQTSLAYILWFCLGVHYFYLNKPFTNILYWITAAGFGIWLIIDVFRIPGLVKEYNEKYLASLIDEARRLYPNT